MVLATIAAQSPNYLSDENEFLSKFLGNDLLSTLGFVVAVTLASIANIHLELNQVETTTSRLFKLTRIALRRSAQTLIILFGVAIALVTIKPVWATSELSEATFNSFALVILYVNLEVLWDITAAVFMVPSSKVINKS